MRRLEVGEAALVQPLQHVAPHHLERPAQQRADQRRPYRRLRRRHFSKAT